MNTGAARQGSDRSSSAAELLSPVDDHTSLRAAFGCFPSGVAAVCARHEGEVKGMLVSSFTSVSLQPPLASISIMNSSRTWSQLREAPRLGVSFLAGDQRDVCDRFTSRVGERFTGLDITTTEAGAVLLGDATAWLECSVQENIPAGDHTIALLRIHTLHARPDAAPLVFHGSRFHRLSA